MLVIDAADVTCATVAQLYHHADTLQSILSLDSELGTAALDFTTCASNGGISDGHTVSSRLAVVAIVITAAVVADDDASVD